MKKNNKTILKIIIVSIIFIIILNITYIYQNHKLKENYNNTINNIIYKSTLTNEKLSKEEIVKILNADKISPNILKEYGINPNKDYLIIANQKIYSKYFIINNITILIFLIIIVIIFIINEKNENKKIRQITILIEQINNKNYYLNIEDNNEDEISILKNEIYKTTVMLKEQAENSNKDKINLKCSLENISHQLKTPLTSISIMLDNLLDNPHMDEYTRNDFIKDINKEINNINFLIQVLLKLSRFDANVIKYNNKFNSLKSIIDKSIDNLSSLCDLKNIQIFTKIPNNLDIYCDSHWQIEAITNILKNCLEHSENGSTIEVFATDNKIYSEIIIKDNGTGIPEKDLKHIFKRFYRGQNSKEDSVGIGLSLAKSIIEKNNGIINVTSSVGKGTTFSIKYFK